MNNRFYFKIFSALLFAVALTAANVCAQTQISSVPRQEKLLNGLKVLMWNDAKAEKVSVKIRVHSGSSFDPQGKEGVMQLLADNIFPTESVREFFSDDLGGSLEITTNYDYIQINATATPEEFITMLETLANAVSKPTIDKETTAKLRAARLEKVKELEKNPAYVADQAVARRLLGTFPYGRPISGTTESLAKIDYADLIFAKDRFFTADNATIAVTGNFKSDLAFRAVRRYFGAWAKSENRVPATFRQPDEPDTKLFIVNSPNVENSEVRYALRGLARNDKDFIASNILIKILQNRLREFAPEEHRTDAFIAQKSNLLPGLVVIGFSKMKPDESGKNAASPERAITDNENSFRKSIWEILFNKKVTNEEFNKGKSEVSAEINQIAAADFWLDVDSYRLTSVKEEMEKINSVTVADLQRVLDKFQKEPVAAVLLRKSEGTRQ